MVYNEGLGVGRGAVAEAYTKLLKDLNKAGEYLPVARSFKAYSISRATQAAAIALKTRIYLHMADYANVISEGKKLGIYSVKDVYSSPVGDYKLEVNVEAPFTIQNNNTESIFSVAQSAAQNGGVNEVITAMLGPAIFKGRDMVATSPNLYNADFWVEGGNEI